METLNATLLPLVQKANAFLADYILIFLLIGTGLFFSIKTKFVQVRAFGEGMKNVFGKLSLKGEKQESGMSGFQALCTAIAAQVGTGNIVGASGAILVGGPGAIFWMWITAIFGGANAFIESTLAQIYKKKADDGTYYGGPSYYMQNALGARWLGIIFSILIIFNYISCIIIGICSWHTAFDTLICYHII